MFKSPSISDFLSELGDFLGKIADETTLMAVPQELCKEFANIRYKFCKLLTKKTKNLILNEFGGTFDKFYDLAKDQPGFFEQFDKTACNLRSNFSKEPHNFFQCGFRCCDRCSAPGRYSGKNSFEE